MQLVTETPMTSAHQVEQESRQRRFMLANIICQTEEMLQLAQMGNWHEVEVLDEQRKQDMKLCFSVSDEDPLISEAIATLIVLNNKIALLIKEARENLLAESKIHHESKHAVSHYQDNNL